ncbi:phage tail tape measure protein [Bacillus sp. CLL-7-23]|uniref:Phage tail tape measure protein n=1 Tax=Bacillus changyiensis TaxID=3004103 RepID=A0ABT4X8E0_9BACI|nr:phage tail tape measure protein [Bacillus changyiensis]MDA1477264.1 phage tail tape measure protein [Bacillus changyiensis]MDA7028528.1 phage tail tape measure protein [Bacillus changyiensis]
MADGKVVIDSIFNGKPAEKGISSFQKRLQSAGASMKAAGTSMSKYITAPIVAFGGAAMASAYKLDQATKNIRAGTGATGKALAGLRKSFDNVFAKVPEDADTVSNALADINTRTGLTGKPLEKLTKQFLDLSRITGQDVSTSIAQITRLFGDWGIKSKDTGKTMDYLWKVSQTTGIGVDQLSTKLVQFGAPLRQIGFSFEESAALMGKWEKEGVNMELVMGGLRVALGKMAKAGKDPQKEFPKIIKQIKGAGSAGEANAIALEHFGARAGADMAAAIREGRFEIDDLMKTLGSSKETIGKAAKDTETLGDKFNILKNNTMLAIEPIGKILLDVANEMIPPLLDALRRAAEWFRNLSKPVQTAIVVAGGFAAALGPMLIVIGKIATGIGPAITAIKKMGTVFKTVSMLFMSNPILIAVAAIAAAAYLIIQNWEPISEFFKNLWEGIVLMAKTIWGGLTAYFSFIFNLYKTIFETVWNVIKAIGESIWNVIVAVAKTIWDGLKAYFSFVLNLYKTIFETVWHAIKTVVTTIWDTIIAVGETVWNGLKSFFTTLFNTLKSFFSKTWNRIKSAVISIWNGIISTGKSVWNGLKSFLTTLINSIKQSFSRVWNGIKSTVTTIWNKISSTTKSIWNNIKGFFSNTLGNMWRTVKEKFQNMVRSVGEKMNAVKSKIKTIWDKVMTFFKKIDLFKIGKDIINGLIKGIGGMADALWKKAKEIADGVVTKFKEILHIASPSKVMKKIGKWTGEGMEIGMDDSVKGIDKASEQLANAAVPDIPDLKGIASSVLNVPAITPNPIHTTGIMKAIQNLADAVLNQPVEVEIEGIQTNLNINDRKFAEVTNEAITKAQKRQSFRDKRRYK